MKIEDNARLTIFADGLTLMGLKLEEIDESSWYMTGSGQKIALITYDPSKPLNERFEIKAVYCDRPLNRG